MGHLGFVSLLHLSFMYHLLEQKANATEGAGGCEQIILDCKMVHLSPALKEPLPGQGVAMIARLSLTIGAF